MEYNCEKCKFNTNNKTDYKRHIITLKHLKKPQIILIKQNICDCGLSYKFRQGLLKHKQKCVIKKNTEMENIVIDFVKQNKDFSELLIEQNNKIAELTKPIIINNNKFNLQIFLNEQCKDALNITEFINSLQLKLTDLENIGKNGYIEGISTIFIRGLKELDICKRPVHCSDLKREILYVKDANMWEKENEENKKIINVIKQIEYKNIKQIPEWREKNPQSMDSETKKHLEYQIIINQSMGGSSENENKNNYNKIIKNVAKEIIITKNTE